MKIAVLEMYAADPMATGARGRAIVRFLRERGHTVDVLAPSPTRLREFARVRFSLSSRLRRRLLHRPALPHLWDYLADDLEPALRAGQYHVVVARLQPVAYVLTRLTRCVKIVDLANIAFLESYHAWNADLSEIDSDYAREMRIFRAADHILLPHDILAEFFRQYVLDSEKVVTVRLGCEPAARVASHSRSPRLVYAGSYEYIQDPWLLSLLSARSPYPIDCYGKKDPNFSFLPSRLNYCGYRDDLGFLADYQAGVITVSADRLRRHSPSTKFAYYFAHGLPVLFPEWMEEGYAYAAAVPYDEANFAAQARRICESEIEWRRLHAAARHTAADLTWDRTLAPLEDLLEVTDRPPLLAHPPVPDPGQPVPDPVPFAKPGA